MELQDLLVIFNLILIEGLLSVDNAAVLAVMVQKLPEHQRGKALKWGIAGAYILRGACLLIASFLMKVWWLKVAGGVYLLYLAYEFFKAKRTATTDDDLPHDERAAAGWLAKRIGLFWATIVAVEFADLAFSIDNVLAAAAMSPKIWVVWVGVFIGILAMRFVAVGFVRLMEKYPGLETSAFYVIALLGIKLCLSAVTHFSPESTFAHIMEGHVVEWGTSALTLVIFFWPVFFSTKKTGHSTTAELAEPVAEEIEA